MAEEHTQNDSGDTGENVDGNVDKIRDILFGGQMRDYERRFADLEARLTRNVEQLSSKFEERAERLDEFARREVEKLSEQLADERKAREEAGQQGSKEFNEIAQKFESWCTALEAQIGSETHDLRGLLHTQAEELSGEIHQAREELGKNLAAETQSLSSRKVARDDLASLLSEVAARLNKDPEPRDA